MGKEESITLVTKAKEDLQEYDYYIDEKAFNLHITTTYTFVLCFTN